MISGLGMRSVFLSHLLFFLSFNSSLSVTVVGSFNPMGSLDSIVKASDPLEEKTFFGYLFEKVQEGYYQMTNQ